MSADDPTRLMVLKEILGETELLAGNDGAVYAQFPRDGELVAYGTHWPEFMTWLKTEATERLNSIPAAHLIKQAIAEVEYNARKGFSYPIAARIHSDESSAVVHLGEGKMLDIRASGAGLNEDAGVVFPTPFNMEPLPELEDAAALEVLPEILDLSDDQCRVVLIWLMALFQPNGRYPVLIITGPKQSGKARVASNIRRLLDPHPVPFLAVPGGLEELKAAIRDNAILAFDDVEDVPDWLEKSLLALAKGMAISVPGRTRPVLSKRPTILVCEDLPDAPDLLEYAVIVRLKERPPQQIKDKHVLDSVFDRLWGKALGALVGVCSAALRHQSAIELAAVHKDAALEKWILAVDKGLNLEGELMVAFMRNLEQALETIVGERPALQAFQALVKAEGTVKATGTELLELIEPFVNGPKDARYPTSGKAMAKLLRDHERFMPEIEIEFNVRTGKDRDRNIVARCKSLRVGVGRVAVAAAPKAAARPKKEKSVAQDQPAFL